MKLPRGLRRTDLRAHPPWWCASAAPVLTPVLTLLLTLLCGAVLDAARAQEAAPNDALPDSVCQRLVDAFETLEPQALRAVLAATDLQIAVSKARGEARSEDRTMSVEQALVFLRGALDVGERRVLDALGPGAILATARTVGCHCPEIGDSGVDAFLVLHFGADERRGQTRRLYLDLRRDAAQWRIRAVRELR